MFQLNRLTEKLTNQEKENKELRKEYTESVYEIKTRVSLEKVPVYE